MSLVFPLPRRRCLTRSPHRLWFFALYVAGCASVATAKGYVGYATVPPLRVPQVGQIVLGLLMVFVVPGLSVVCATLPELRSWVERLLASVGISIIVATCAAMLLAATPIGLSRQPLEELLGGVAIVLSIGGLYRSRLAATVGQLRARVNWELRAWRNKHLIGNQREPQRVDNSAKRQQKIGTDDRRSVVVLKFSFDGKSEGPRT